MIFDITWGAPERAWVLLFFIVAVGLLWFKYVKIQAAVAALSGSWTSHLIGNFSPWRSVLKLIFMGVAILFLCLTIVRPEGVKEKDSVMQEGRDLFIALDVSRSMLVADVEPNRLACAKQKIKNILHNLSCERVGLLLFSGSAFVQCPLTSDYAAFYMFLDHVDAESISSGTTSIDKALIKTVEMFEEMPSKKSKLLIMITDGEDFSTDLVAVKRKATEQGLHIFTLGIGSTQGAPVPLFDAEGRMVGHQKDNRGQVVISRLNEHVLSNLAHDVGGVYLRVTRDNSDVKSLVRHVQKFEKEQFKNQAVERMQQYYPYFLLVSFVCLLGEWLL